MIRRPAGCLRIDPVEPKPPSSSSSTKTSITRTGLFLADPVVKDSETACLTADPESLDDWIGEDNPVRVIDVFVDESNWVGLGSTGSILRQPPAVDHRRSC